MGSPITKLKAIGGCCAETAGAITLFGTALTGIPVSTTRTITGAVVGVGSTTRLSAVRRGVGWPHRLGLDLYDSSVCCGFCAIVLHNSSVPPWGIVSSHKNTLPLWLSTRQRLCGLASLVYVEKKIRGCAVPVADNP